MAYNAHTYTHCCLAWYMHNITRVCEYVAGSLLGALLEQKHP